MVVPINVLHHSPEYWPDPYKFDPERYVRICVMLECFGYLLAQRYKVI